MHWRLALAVRNALVALHSLVTTLVVHELLSLVGIRTAADA